MFLKQILKDTNENNTKVFYKMHMNQRIVQIETIQHHYRESYFLNNHIHMLIRSAIRKKICN